MAMLLVIVLISFLTFALFELIPNGDPAARIAGRTATAAEIQQINVKYGFDKPFYVQYVRTMKNIFTGQAISYTQGFNVLDEIRAGLPATVSLALGAGILWLLTSILVGTLAAVRAGKYTDRVLTVLAMAGVSFPPFFLGAVFIYFLGYKWNIFPIGGYVKFTSNPGAWFGHLVLPWVTLSVLFVGFYSRVLRSTILDTINEDYVRTARAKGLSERQVLIRHILRNSLIPIISLWGLDLAQVIGGGAILTESVYNLHGVGQLAADSIGRLDIIPILCIVMLTAFAVVILAALIDILYAYLDPRIRLAA
jgi:peptide/nickel transport system permease protein